MRKRKVWGYFGVMSVFLLGAVFAGVLSNGSALAQTATSPNYQMTETDFGATSSDETCSGQYCSRVTMGQISNTSPQTTPELGAIEYSEPMLEVSVSAGPSNLGTLTTERTATQTMVVKIRNYQTEGYLLQIIGDAPKFDGHQLATSTEPEISQPGKEQFGMNIVANTSPTVGAQPVYSPSDQTMFGETTPAYSTSNMFMYKSGDIFARGMKDRATAEYTISMIVNIANSTPAGHYSGDFAAVLVPTY